MVRRVCSALRMSIRISQLPQVYKCLTCEGHMRQRVPGQAHPVGTKRSVGLAIILLSDHIVYKYIVTQLTLSGSINPHSIRNLR